MNYDRIVCRLLRHVCRESSDPAAPELCREYLGEAAEVFVEGSAPATSLAVKCADALGLVVAGGRVYLADKLASLIVDSATWLARRYHELLFKDVEPGLLASRQAPKEPPLDPVASLNTVIAAYLSRVVDGAVVVYSPCPYRPDATHNPLVVAGEPRFESKLVGHGGCVVEALRELPRRVPGRGAVYDGSVVKVDLRGLVVEVRPGEVLRTLGVGGRGR